MSNERPLPRVFVPRLLPLGITSPRRRGHQFAPNPAERGVSCSSEKTRTVTSSACSRPPVGTGRDERRATSAGSRWSGCTPSSLPALFTIKRGEGGEVGGEGFEPYPPTVLLSHTHFYPCLVSSDHNSGVPFHSTAVVRARLDPTHRVSVSDGSDTSSAQTVVI